MTKEFLLHKDKKNENPAHIQAHLVFADTQPNPEKTKRANFRPRPYRITIIKK
jgi:hypothetical protein